MPGPRDVALDHYAERKLLVEAAAQVAAKAWGQVDPDDILRSWLEQLSGLTTAVSGAQLRAAQAADGYTTDVLEAQGLDTAADARVAARAFAGAASDGRSLATLLANPAITALSAIKDGVDVARALAAGHANLNMIVRTQVADAGRIADQTALVARPSATGYVRVAVGKTCNRCMILAGKRYRWNDGFLRHPRCDCIHLGCDIAEAAHLVQDPEELYARMSPAERTRAGFTAADQAAIRDGADLNQVVNAHRGMYTTVVGGRTIRATREGTTVRGVFGGFEIDPDTGALRRRASSELENRRSGSRRIGAARAPRLTPEQIYRIAGDNRDEAIRLLRRNGYLVDRGPVRIAGGAPTGGPSALRHAGQPERPRVAAAALEQLDGLDDLELHQLRGLASEFDVPNARHLERDELLRELREQNVVSPARRRALAAEAEASAPRVPPNQAVPRLDDLIKQARQAPYGSAERQAVTDQIARGVTGRFGGLEIDGVEVSVGGVFDAVAVSGQIFKDGREVGIFERMFEIQGDGKRVATHSYLQLDADVQGSGFQREFNGNLFDWYKRSGFDRVEVAANIDVGGYTWASVGFDFSGKRAASDFARWAKGKLSDMRAASGDDLSALFPGTPAAEARGLFDEMAQRLDRLVKGKYGTDGYPTAYEISQLGRKPGMGKSDTWIGKYLMLGSHWEGVLRL